MDQFSYVVGLLSIITGLALSDIGISLHRLLRRRRDVRWDWFVLAIAAYLGFIIVRYWYQVWSIRDFAGVSSLFFFLGIVIENFVLFLIAASSLPDAEELGPKKIDLRAFQAETNRYLWTLFTVYSAMWGAHGIYFNWFYRGFVNERILLVFFVPIVLGMALALARKRRVQQLLFGLMLAQELWWITQSGF